MSKPPRSVWVVAFHGNPAAMYGSASVARRWLMVGESVHRYDLHRPKRKPAKRRRPK